MPTTIHQEAEFWVTAAASGNLTATELKAWHEHVATCPACKELYDQELSMNKLMKTNAHSESPDPGFERRIISKFRQVYSPSRTRQRDFFRLMALLAGSAACAALVALVGIGSLIKTQKSVLAEAASPAGDLQAFPPAVRQTILANSEGRTISRIERTEDNGEVSYAVATTAQDGEEWDLTVADDGSLMSIDLAPTELPAAVQAALNAQVGQGTLEGVQKLIDGGETTYQAGITAPQGGERDFTYAEDGTLLSEEVSLAELPAAVQTAIHSQVGQGRLEGIDKTFDDQGFTYEATMTTPAGQERNFSISSEGRLLSREVSLNEVPGPVRQTISQTLDKGKIVEIDQSFVADNQVLPYEIDGEKDGKPCDFKISPTGQILGVEE